MKRLVGLVLLAVVARSSVDSASSGDHFDDTYVTHIEYLKRKLVTDREYDPTTRPGNNSSEPTVVHIPVNFPNIQHIVLADGWFSVVLWLCMNWKDDRLEGSKEDFQGVPRIRVDLSEVWWPRVDVVTAGQEDSEFLPRFALLTPEAGVWMCYTTKVRSPCSVDTGDFPNDEQVCSIRLMSSAYSDSEVKLAAGYVWGTYQPNASTEWNVTDISFRNHTDLDRSFVEIFFHLRRFGLRHRYTTIVPCVASALVMLATFWVPPASDRRLIVTCLNVVFVALMLHRTAATIGSSITTSNILLFLGLATIVQAVAAIGNVAVLNGLAFGRRIEVPYILRRFISGTAGTVLCLIEPQQPRTSAQKPAVEEPQLSTFNNAPKLNEHWLLSMQALDRLFFVVFAFMTLGFLV